MQLLGHGLFYAFLQHIYKYIHKYIIIYIHIFVLPKPFILSSFHPTTSDGLPLRAGFLAGWLVEPSFEDSEGARAHRATFVHGISISLSNLQRGWVYICFCVQRLFFHARKMFVLLLVVIWQWCDQLLMSWWKPNEADSCHVNFADRILGVVNIRLQVELLRVTCDGFQRPWLFGLCIIHFSFNHVQI